MKTGKRLASAAIGLAAAAALAAAPAGASVGDRIAAGPDGTAHFLWEQSGPYGFNQIHERTLLGNGTLAEAGSISSLYRNVRTARFGADAAGNTIYAWKHSDDGVDTLLTRRRGADGSLGPIQRVAESSAALQHFALDVEPDGDAILVWQRDSAGNDGSIVSARRRSAATGSLGPVVTVSSTVGYSFDPDVAVAPDGTATVAWQRNTASSDRFMQVRAIDPDNTLRPTQSLTTPTGSLYEPHVRVNDAGTAVIAWQRPTGESTQAIQSRARSAGGVLGATQTISASADQSFLETAGDGTGRTAYLWAEPVSPGHWTLRGRVRQANGILSPIFDVSPGEAVGGKVAIDPSGNVTFAWQVPGETGVVQTRRRTLAGTLGPVRTLSAPEENASGPDVAVDRAGKATISYSVSPTGRIHARTVTPAGTVSPARWVNGWE